MSEQDVLGRAYNNRWFYEAPTITVTCMTTMRP